MDFIELYRERKQLQSKITEAQKRLTEVDELLTKVDSSEFDEFKEFLVQRQPKPLPLREDGKVKHSALSYRAFEYFKEHVGDVFKKQELMIQLGGAQSNSTQRVIDRAIAEKMIMRVGHGTYRILHF